MTLRKQIDLGLIMIILLEIIAHKYGCYWDTSRARSETLQFYSQCSSAFTGSPSIENAFTDLLKIGIKIFLISI